MRYWSILFAVIAIACVIVFAIAPFQPDWWLPRNVSSHGSLGFGGKIDHLYVLILWITGLAFIGTQIALVLTLWKFPAHPGRRAVYFHGSQRLEVIWTIIPAAILVFLALYQMGVWADIKFRSAAPKVQPLAEVTARQFQWKIRYPGPDGRIGTADDLHTTNDLRFVQGQPVVIHLKTEDVIHSFFLPNFRVKQDAVPGLTIPVWFDADQPCPKDDQGRYEPYDLACAELCGWGHTKMRGLVTIYETQAEFDDWVNRALAEQNRSRLEPTEATTTTAALQGGD